MSLAPTATAFDKNLIEDRDLPAPVLSHGLDQSHMRSAGPTKPPQANSPAVLGPLRQVRDQIDSKQAAGRQHISNGPQRRRHVRVADERLKNAVGRHDQMKGCARSERQGADVAAYQRHMLREAGAP